MQYAFVALFGAGAVVVIACAFLSHLVTITQSKKRKSLIKWGEEAERRHAHLSGLKADSLKSSKSQVVPVGELSESTDDPGKQTEETDSIYKLK